MASRPITRARRKSILAVDRAARDGISLVEAARLIDAEVGGRPPTAAELARLAPGEDDRRQLEACRRDVRSGEAEWLAGTPEEIMAAVDAAIAPGGLKLTAAQRERLLHLTRAGMPIKDSPGGVGIARLLGTNSASLWMAIKSDAALNRDYREARDDASEVLEDEMRALLPVAIVKPELLDALTFIAGRLEWLAKAKNRERYSPDARRAFSGANHVTFNIGGRTVATLESTPLVEAQAAADAAALTPEERPRNVMLQLALADKARAASAAESQPPAKPRRPNAKTGKPVKTDALAPTAVEDCPGIGVDQGEPVALEAQPETVTVEGKR